MNEGFCGPVNFINPTPGVVTLWPGGQSLPLLVFVNKVLLKEPQYSLAYCPWLCSSFAATTAELSCFYRDHLTHKAYLALYRKSLLTPALPHHWRV